MIDHQSKTPASYVTELMIGSGRLPPGHYETALWVKKRVRLRVRFMVEPGLSRILGHDDPQYAPMESQKQGRP